MKDLLTLAELTKEEIASIIERAITLKGLKDKPLAGKTLGMIFEKASTRTRVSFEAAMYQLGGYAIFLNQSDSQVGRGEPVKDTARVMSSYVDGVVIRTFGHEMIEEFAEYASVPVINGLTDKHHPCQVLADVLTMVEKKGSGVDGLKGLKVVWLGDGNNMANSWIEAASRLPFKLVLACPEGYQPDEDIVKRSVAEGGEVELCSSVKDALKDADVINTDVWASMGWEDESEKRVRALEAYQLNSENLSYAKPDAMVLHCLPAHRGEEITEDVIEGKNSSVWEQAANRLHVQKAILEKLLS